MAGMRDKMKYLWIHLFILAFMQSLLCSGLLPVSDKQRLPVEVKRGLVSGIYSDHFYEILSPRSVEFTRRYLQYGYQNQGIFHFEQLRLTSRDTKTFEWTPDGRYLLLGFTRPDGGSGSISGEILVDFSANRAKYITLVSLLVDASAAFLLPSGNAAIIRELNLSDTPANGTSRPYNYFRYDCRKDLSEEIAGSPWMDRMIQEKMPRQQVPPFSMIAQNPSRPWLSLCLYNGSLFLRIAGDFHQVYRRTGGFSARNLAWHPKKDLAVIYFEDEEQEKSCFCIFTIPPEAGQGP